MRQWIQIVLLVVLTAVVFSRVTDFKFQRIDDTLHVTQNSLLRAPFWGNFKENWRGPYQGLFIPVTYTYWQLIAAWDRWSGTEVGSAKSYHFMNLVLHSLNGLLVFIFLRRLGLSAVARFFATALFLIHPMQVESVAWVSGAKDLLACFFGLSSLILFTEGNRRNQGFVQSLALLPFVLGILSKPSLAIMPFYFILIQLWTGRSSRVGLGVIVAAIGCVIPILQLTLKLQPAFFLNFVAPLKMRPLLWLDSTLFYLGKYIFPVGLGLNYGRTPELILKQAPLFLEGAAVCLIFMCLRFIYQRKYFVLGIALFLVAILPNSGLFPFYYQTYSNVADRFCYFGVLGLALASVSLVNQPWVLTASVITLSVISFIQTLVWKDPLSLALRTVQVNPSRQNKESLAVEYQLQAELSRKQGQFLFAETQLKAAIGAAPFLREPYNSLGTLYAEMGRGDEAEKMFRKALWVDATFANAHLNLGLLFEEKGLFEDARQEYQIAIREKHRTEFAEEGLKRIQTK